MSALSFLDVPPAEQSTAPPYGQGSIPEEKLDFTRAGARAPTLELHPGLLHPEAPQVSAEFPWGAVPGVRRSLKHQGFVTSWRRLF